MNCTFHQHLIICGEDQTADYVLTGIKAMARGDHVATGIVPRRCVALVSSPAAAERLGGNIPRSNAWSATRPPTRRCAPRA